MHKLRNSNYYFFKLYNNYILIFYPVEFKKRKKEKFKKKKVKKRGKSYL